MTAKKEQWFKLAQVESRLTDLLERLIIDNNPWNKLVRRVELSCFISIALFKLHFNGFHYQSQETERRWRRRKQHYQFSMAISVAIYGYSTQLSNVKTLSPFIVSVLHCKSLNTMDESEMFFLLHTKNTDFIHLLKIVTIRFEQN